MKDTQAIFNEPHVEQILLVQAIEENRPDYFTPEILSKAQEAAGSFEDKGKWFEKRSSFLYANVSPFLQRIPQVIKLPFVVQAALLSLAFLIGVTSNYLGSDSHFHVLYNPVMFLILWNLMVYLALVVSFLFGLRNRMLSSAGETTEASADAIGEKPASAAQAACKQPSTASSPAKFTADFLTRQLYRWSKRSAKDRADEQEALSYPAIARTYRQLHREVASALQYVRLRQLFHFCAIGLVAGALCGIYLRGLFAEYYAVWRSTFINEPHIVSLFVNCLLGLPSLITKGSLVSVDDIVELSGSKGSPAADWIHLLSIAVIAYVCVPRTLLIVFDAVRSKRLSERISLDLGANYFRRTISEAYKAHIQKLKLKLENILVVEFHKFSESVSVFVQNGLYERQIVPALIAFRSEGGRVVDLEKDIESIHNKFRDEIQHHIESEQVEMQTSISAKISSLLGRELCLPDTSFAVIPDLKSISKVDSVAQSMANDMGKTISITITACVTGVIGTISGGFGKTLGIAIVSTLFHATGPVGWAIGAATGLALAGGSAWILKDRILDKTKNIKLPSFATKFLMRDSKLEKQLKEGGEKIHAQIEGEILKVLSPMVPKLVDQLISNLNEALTVR